MNNMGVHLKEGTESELQKGRRCNQHLKKCGRQHLLGTGCASLRFRMSYESTDNHIALEVLPNACAVCGACDATLLTCTRCEVVRYCGREHQKVCVVTVHELL